MEIDFYIVSWRYQDVPPPGASMWTWWMTSQRCCFTLLVWSSVWGETARLCRCVALIRCVSTWHAERYVSENYRWISNYCEASLWPLIWPLCDSLIRVVKMFLWGFQKWTGKSKKDILYYCFKIHLNFAMFTKFEAELLKNPTIDDFSSEKRQNISNVDSQLVTAIELLDAGLRFLRF